MRQVGLPGRDSGSLQLQALGCGALAVLTSAEGVAKDLASAARQSGCVDVLCAALKELPEMMHGPGRAALRNLAAADPSLTASVPPELLAE